MSQSAWEIWVVSDAVRTTLWGAKKRLRVAWRLDLEDPKNFPINTSVAIGQIQQTVSQQLAKKFSRPAMPRLIYEEPRTLEDLIPLRLVKTIWEDRHNGRFESAITRAAATDYKDPKKSWKVFKGIVRAMETAYLVEYWGWELLPRPKVNILHRGLDEIAKAAGLGAQTNKGFSKFLDDLCPCGLQRHEEAVRKFRHRIAHRRRT